jgi:ribosomal protein L11 methyltransferase
MDWRQFTMNLNSLEADEVESVFSRHGALSITFSDAGDNPVLEPAPGETPMWSNTKITGLFTADADFQSLREDLLSVFDLDDLPANEIEDLEERAWEREWLKDFRPMKFGHRLWVSPKDMVVEDDNAIIVRLDPGLAFGTGTHETTALCLEWLDSLDLAGKRVLDMGCGSGILAIAATKLGASVAHGTDIDPQAIIASHQNAADNGVSDKTTFVTDPSLLDNQYDIVIANILAGTLIELAAEISKRTVHGGRMALSGILSAQVSGVSDAFAPWFTLKPATMNNDWARVTGQRN